MHLFVCDNFSSVRNIAQKDNIVVNGIVYKKKFLQSTCRHSLTTEFFSACSDATFTSTEHSKQHLFWKAILPHSLFIFKVSIQIFVLLVILLLRGTCKCQNNGIAYAWYYGLYQNGSQLNFYFLLPLCFGYLCFLYFHINFVKLVTLYHTKEKRFVVAML